MRFLYFGIYDSDFSRNRIYIRALRSAGHEIIECKDRSSGLLKYVRLVQRLRALKGSYDVIIVGYPGHVVVPLARLFGTAPVVSDLLGSLSDAAQHTYDAGFLVQTWFSWVDRLAIAFSDAILVDSEAQKAYMQRRYGSGQKYRVVYTGADEEVFGPRGEHSVAPTDPFTVLFRGRLIPQSGIMHILDAAESLLNDKRFAFRIIGYGPMLKAVRERASALSNVELISEHVSFEEMRRLILNADVSLGQFGDNARSDRNIPHKAFESMSMGIPYVTARVPGMFELLEDEVSCLMVPLENPEAIKAALKRLRDDRSLGKRLAENARIVYESRASARAISAAITAIAISCIEARNFFLTGTFPRIGKREVMTVFVLLAAFVAIRMPGLSLPYHQDEAKIGEIVREQLVGSLAAHPPLTELTYRWAGKITGADHLRIIPLIFATISAVLLYAVVRKRSGVRAALCSLFLYAICMYSVFASLMVDTDGAILPTYFLLCVFAYDRFLHTSELRRSSGWVLLLILALLLGFLTKLSFVLVLGALILDYLFEIRHRLTLRIVTLTAFALAIVGAIGAAALLGAHLLLPSFDMSQTIDHALWYVRFEGRGYMQIAIQGIKAIFYSSPLLLLPLVLASRADVQKNRIFAVYLAVGAVFYFVLFDFSQGALDKYLMFMIVPCAALCGTILARTLMGLQRRELLYGLLLGAALASMVTLLNFISPSVIPMYPKAEWITSILSGNWNILFPFTGGDGPTGVYFSFLVIAVAFILSAILVIFVRFRSRAALVALIVVGVTFNALFIEEYLYGRINGSAGAVLRTSLAYIDAHQIGPIISHAEIGAYELKARGEYAGRFYAVPGYEPGHRALFAAHTGAYLVVQVPLFNAESFYAKYFATCTSIFKTNSGVIEGDIYDCTGSDPYAIH